MSSKPTAITREYKGYTNRLEITNTPDPSFIVEGSQNVIVDWMNTIGSRKGYELYGAAGATGGITGEFKWRTNRGQFYNFRKNGTAIEVKRTVDDVVSWFPLVYQDGTTYLPVETQLGTFASVFNDTRKIDELLFAGGNARFFSWSGALGVVASATTTTIVLDTAPGTLGFAATGTVSVNGTTFTYTGITTNTFTGVTPDASALTAGMVAHERVKSNAISTIPANFTADHIGVFRNQAYIGSNTSRVVPVSSAVDYTNFTTSTAVGGPRLLTFDDTCAGFEGSKKSMLVFGNNESLFEIKYTISADQTKEYFEIERLATSPNQGVIAPKAKMRVKNAVMYITNEKTLDSVQFTENISDEQVLPISDLIKNDFDNFDFTGAALGYWERNILIAIPAENLVYMYDLERGLWQAPMTFTGATIGMFSVDENGDLIGHDAFTSQSYLLFVGDNDGGEAITSTAVFSYNHFGDRFSKKRFTSYVQDGYITANGTLTRTLDYDYVGSKQSIPLDFSGDELDYIYSVADQGGLGKAPLGQRTLGGSSLIPTAEQRRFRYADALVPFDFYELRVSYSMSTLDASWRLVAHGSDTMETETNINDITRIRS